MQGDAQSGSTTIYGFVGGLANVSCEVHAEPRADLAWLKDGSEITEEMPRERRRFRHRLYGVVSTERVYAVKETLFGNASRRRWKLIDGNLRTEVNSLYSSDFVENIYKISNSERITSLQVFVITTNDFLSLLSSQLYSYR